MPFTAGPGRVCSFCGRDLWEVARFVSAGSVTICDGCVSEASEALASLTSEGRRELFLPPRVFGQVPDDGAVEAITESFRIVFGGGAGQPDLVRSHLDGDDEVASALEAAGQRNPGVGPSSTRVDRVLFLDADRADVRFQIRIGVGAFPFEGEAVRREGRWLVSRETAARVAVQGGAQVGPRLGNRVFPA